MPNTEKILKNATPEQLQKAAACKTAEEFLAFLKAEKIEITAEQAEELFKMPPPPTGELSDEELDAVSGGEIELMTTEYMCPYCQSQDLGNPPFAPWIYICRSCGKSFHQNDAGIKLRTSWHRCPQCKSTDLGNAPFAPWIYICRSCGTQFSDSM